MRSGDWPARRASPAERRVLVMGDSVVAGGSLVGQEQLATARLGVALSAERGAAVLVGNASAPSWGPPNLLAWAAVHGWLDADAVAIVVSSHDARDVPSPTPLEERGLPVRRPVSALAEGLFVYLPRLLAPQPTPPPPERAPARGAGALEDFERLLAAAGGGGRAVLVALHRSRAELEGPEPPDLRALRLRADRAGAAVVRLAPAFRAALARGEAPYRDDLHPTALGQAVIAAALEGPLLDALAAREARGQPDF